MDWISKIEEEDHMHAQAEHAKKEAERKRREAKIASFQIVKDRICPALQATVEQVHRRLGITLRLNLADAVIRVSAPKRVGSIRRASHPYTFDISEFYQDQSTVRVRALVDGRIERHGEPPATVSDEEYYGRMKTIMDVRSDLDEFAESDLQLLLEWLVVLTGRVGSPARRRLRQYAE